MWTKRNAVFLLSSLTETRYNSARFDKVQVGFDDLSAASMWARSTSQGCSTSMLLSKYSCSKRACHQWVNKRNNVLSMVSKMTWCQVHLLPDGRSPSIESIWSNLQLGGIGPKSRAEGGWDPSKSH